MLTLVKLLIAFSVSMHVICVMLVQRFEPRGTNFHFYCYLDEQIFVSAQGVVECIAN